MDLDPNLLDGRTRTAVQLVRKSPVTALVSCVVFVALTRRWRPALYIAIVMLGELAAFLIAAAVVRRPGPDVTHLDHHLPTSAYPSRQEAATCCLYVAVAILVVGHTRGWWQWLSLAPAIAMPALVAISRMYWGETRELGHDTGRTPRGPDRRARNIARPRAHQNH